MKIRPVGVELFHADGQTNRQTDITKLIVAFLNFSYAPKKKHQSQYLVAKTSRQYAERKIVLASDTHIKHS